MINDDRWLYMINKVNYYVFKCKWLQTIMTADHFSRNCGCSISRPSLAKGEPQWKVYSLGELVHQVISVPSTKKSGFLYMCESICTLQWLTTATKRGTKTRGGQLATWKRVYPKSQWKKLKPETHGPMVFPHETWISRAAHPDYPTDIIPIFLVYHALPCKHTPKKYGEPMTTQHV